MRSTLEHRRTETVHDAFIPIEREEIMQWLREKDEASLEELWRRANETRSRFIGDEVHLRGLIEFSNHCFRQCAYCGIRAGNLNISRYRMSLDEIMVCAHQAVQYDYGTVVLQSGEDYGISTAWIADLIRRIKSETPLAVTLSLGERSFSDFFVWKRAGADRYLIRFETSNPLLFQRIHPRVPGRNLDRIAILRQLKEIGYETGSGIMVGIPGQTYEDLVNDIELFRTLELDMIGVGPFIPHPATPLGQARNLSAAASSEQVPNTEMMTYKVVALTRLGCPFSNIPSTTALATLNLANGRELGLQRGANIIMPNLTPPQYRVQYEIYPAKACIRETAEQCHSCLRRRIESIGRTVGKGRGDSLNFHNKGVPR